MGLGRAAGQGRAGSGCSEAPACPGHPGGVSLVAARPQEAGAELRGTLRWHRCHSVSVLQKLPFTIPELVQSSPCRSSDGVLYTGTRAPPQGPPGLRWGGGPAEQLQERRGVGGPEGVRHGVDVLLFAGKKQDTWFVVDPKSGEKQTTLSTEASDGLCPSSPLLYIGRTRKPALLCRVPVLGCLPTPWGPGLPREGCVTSAVPMDRQGAVRLGLPSS